MNIRKALTRDHVLLHIRSDEKKGVIREMIDFLADRGHLPDRKAALQAVLERERKMSTGMQNGVAIPHGKTDAVDRLVVAVGLKPEGMDFACMDGLPARIFVMTISPASRSGPHIQFLAEISRLLNDETVRRQVLAASTAEDVVRNLAS